MSSFRPPAPVVWLNGWSGVGKLSVAQALQTLQGREKIILVTHKTPDSAVSSHPPTPEVERPDPLAFASPPSSTPLSPPTSDPASTTSCVPPSASPSGADSSTASTSTLAAISAPENCDRTVLMTHRVPLDDLDHIEAAREYREHAMRSGRLFLPVTVECQLAENMRRLNSEERRARRNSVLSADEAHRVREGNRLFEFADVEGLVLNTTKMSPIDAAMRLMEWINKQVDSERCRLREQMEAEEEARKKEEEKRPAKKAERCGEEARTEDWAGKEEKGKAIESDIERARRLVEGVDGAFERLELSNGRRTF